MEPAHSPSVVITRVAERQWQAVADDQVIGRGDASPRPDGRIFVSIDSWHGAAFDALADAMLASLPMPLYTVVDEIDHELTANWTRVGFATRRREVEYLVATAPDSGAPDVTILPAGAAEESLIRGLYNKIRAEVDWESMPAEVIQAPHEPSKYAVATESGEYVGLVRAVARRRHARIGLIAVRAGLRRRGIARALLAHTLDSLHRNGIDTATAEVDESNAAAIALFEGFGAQRASSNLELVLHDRAKGR